MRKLFYPSLIACIVLFAISCKKDNNSQSSAPQISFANFTTSDASHAVFTFNFSDADGDIGLQSGDTSGPYAAGTVGYYDLYMRYYYKNYLGSFVTYYFPWPGLDTSSYPDHGILTYRIPYINNTSKVKSLNGQIIINMNSYKPPADSAPLQHFRYEFWIYDRALHKSNVVTTPEFDTPY